MTNKASEELTAAGPSSSFVSYDREKFDSVDRAESAASAAHLFCDAIAAPSLLLPSVVDSSETIFTTSSLKYYQWDDRSADEE